MKRFVLLVVLSCTISGAIGLWLGHTFLRDPGPSIHVLTGPITFYLKSGISVTYEEGVIKVHSEDDDSWIIFSDKGGPVEIYNGRNYPQMVSLTTVKGTESLTIASNDSYTKEHPGKAEKWILRIPEQKEQVNTKN
jgi:hypothetical protein